MINKIQFPRCPDGMCGGCERCAPWLFVPVKCVDCGRTYPAYAIDSEDRCLDCWIALEEACKKEKEMAKMISLNDENNRIYAKYAKQKRREERIIRLMECSLIAVLVAYAVLTLAVAASVMLGK